MKKLLRRLSGFDRKKEDKEDEHEDDEIEEDEYEEEEEVDEDEAEEEDEEEDDEEDEYEEEEETDEDEDETEDEEDDEYEEEEVVQSKNTEQKKGFFSRRQETKPVNKPDEDEKAWLGGDYEEGQLSIDVYQTNDAIIVKSTIAGVKPEDIDIAINNDMLTIRGRREMEESVSEGDYLYRECYWGSFSRSVILPVEIEADKVEADLENGVLSVRLPKAKVSKQVQIKVKSK